VKKGAARFEVKHCSQCGEVTLMKKLTQTPDGRLVCVSCENKEKKD